jgi:hypothetical protein
VPSEAQSTSKEEYCIPVLQNLNKRILKKMTYILMNLKGKAILTILVTIGWFNQWLINIIIEIITVSYMIFSAIRHFDTKS